MGRPPVHIVELATYYGGVVFLHDVPDRFDSHLYSLERRGGDEPREYVLKDEEDVVWGGRCWWDNARIHF